MKLVSRLPSLNALAQAGLSTVRRLDAGLSALPRMEMALLIGLFLFVRH